MDQQRAASRWSLGILTVLLAVPLSGCLAGEVGPAEEEETSEREASAALPRPLVPLWVNWNDLMRSPDWRAEVMAIPTAKLNGVMLSFNAPLDLLDPSRNTPQNIRPVVQLIQSRGLKVVAFVAMEIYTERFPAGALVQMRDANNQRFVKNEKHLASFWDPAFRTVMQTLIRDIKAAGPDYIIAGEHSDLTSEQHDFTAASVAAFNKQTNSQLPATLGAALAKALGSETLSRKWFTWKYREYYEWLHSIKVQGLPALNGVQKYRKPRPSGWLTSPPTFADASFILIAQGFEGKTDEPAATVKDEIEMLREPGKINLSYLRYLENGELIADPELLRGRATSLKRWTMSDRILNGFVFYGANLWKKYQDYLPYAPALAAY